MAVKFRYVYSVVYCCSLFLLVRTVFCLNSKPTEILSLPLLDLSSFAASVDVFEEKKLVLSPNCSNAYQGLTDNLTNFTTCSMLYARPVNVCMKCRVSYQNAVAAYQNMKKQDTECQEFYFGSDQLEVVDVMFSTVNNLWQKASCQSCYSLYNETEVFLQASIDYMQCIQSTNASVTSSNNTCDKCHSFYGNLSESFQKFVNWQKESDEKICMDVIDAMNISRRIWKDYNCIVVFGTDIGFPNVLTALTVGATPVMFYLLAKNISRLEDVKIVRQKRKFTTVTPPPSETSSD